MKVKNILKRLGLLFLLLFAGAVIYFYLTNKDKVHYFINSYSYSSKEIDSSVDFKIIDNYISIPMEHNGSVVNALFDTGSQTVKPVKVVSGDIKSNSTLMTGKGFNGNPIDVYFHRDENLRISGNNFDGYVGYVGIEQIENGEKLLDRFNLLLGPELLPSKGFMYIDNVKKKLIPSSIKLDYNIASTRFEFKIKVQFPTPKIFIKLDENLDWFLLDTGSSTEITSTSTEYEIIESYNSLKLPAIETYKQGQKNAIGIPFLNKFDVIEINYDEEVIAFLK